MRLDLVYQLRRASHTLRSVVSDVELWPRLLEQVPIEVANVSWFGEDFDAEEPLEWGE